jgi:hypothetical protein
MLIHVVHIVTAGFHVVRYNSNILRHLFILVVKLLMPKAVVRSRYCPGCRFICKCCTFTVRRSLTAACEVRKHVFYTENM